jgi:hypothetical protein
MTNCFDDLISQPIMVEDPIESRREAFRNANASCLTLGGYIAGDALLELQEKIIQGYLTTEEAIVKTLADIQNGNGQKYVINMNAERDDHYPG